MCRFIVYKGAPLLLADLVTRPEHSLINQSYHAKERSEPLNGDGFGVGWYSPEIDQTPCILTSTTPAWSNKNLMRLANKVISPCIFAHVRAATPGMSISESNCHPFQFGPYMWMHNGNIAEFSRMKRLLVNSLSDELFQTIEGTTDSEHAFALFLNQLPDPHQKHSEDVLCEAMSKTIGLINSWCAEAGIHSGGYYNFALTDGTTVVATKAISPYAKKPASLYCSQKSTYHCKDGVCSFTPATKTSASVLIASEPLTSERESWEPIPENHMVVISDSLAVRMLKIDA